MKNKMGATIGPKKGKWQCKQSTKTELKTNHESSARLALNHAVCREGKYMTGKHEFVLLLAYIFQV